MSEAPATPAPHRAEDDPSEVLRAFNTVLRFSLTEALGLVGEEVSWLGYHLAQITAPLRALRPTSVPLAVRQELNGWEYSRILRRVEDGDRINVPVAALEGRTASVHDWVAVLMQTIRRCYQPDPFTEASISGQLTTLLVDLGVDDPQNPRGMLFIPMAMRERLNAGTGSRR